MNPRYMEHSRLFKALSDPNRLMIVDVLSRGELCACVILEKLQITQPTLSHHMKILVDSGIVNARRAGKWTHYSINEDGSKRAVSLLRDLTTVSCDDLPDADCC